MSDLMMTYLAPVRQSIRRTAPKHPIEALRIVLRTYLTRRELPKLSERELADIGLSRMTALREAARLPWDAAPRRWANTGGLGGRAREALERARTRRLLVRMSARALHDPGISLSDATTAAENR